MISPKRKNGCILRIVMEKSELPVLGPIKVVKASGEVVPFDEAKLVLSLERSGADDDSIALVLKEVRTHLFEGITTKKIYKMAFAILRKNTEASAARYQLKTAIAELGPTGHPFERLIGALFEHQGYKVRVGQLVQGHCVQHEVDVIAQKKEQRYLMECKFHSDTTRKCDVKVPLYIQSRFLDVEKAWKAKEPNLQCGGWVVTNARFTGDAIQYGTCVGLNLLSWDYPRNESLKARIDASGLHPITCLTTLKKSEKQQLLNDSIILCQDLHFNPDALNGMGLGLVRIDKVMKEVAAVCRK